MSESPKPSFEEALKDLGNLIVALQPVREDVVLCGGFAAWMYRFHPDLGQEHASYLLTLDMDWAVPASMPAARPSIMDLLEGCDFGPIFFRGATPPIVRYQHLRWGTTEPAAIHAEFLTPLRGKDTGISAVEVTPGGINATVLRYMDLALSRPIMMELDRVTELHVPQGTSIQIPHPGNYLLHKTLTAPERGGREKKDKDLAYIFDVAVLCRPIWANVALRIATFEEHGERKKWLQRARANLHAWFEAPESYGCLAVADVLTAGSPERPVRASTIAKVMAIALPKMGLLPKT